MASADRLKRWAALASVGVAVTLIIAKAAAWVVTGSVSLLSTLIDSLLDLAASLLNLIAIRQAAVPPDSEHRFGHGKAEPLAGLGQAAFISGSAAFLLFEATQRSIRPRPIENEEVGLAVMVFSIVLTLGLVLFEKWVTRRTGSVAVRADAAHYTSDLLVNLGVIAALLLVSHFGWTRADPLIAIVVALCILVSAWQVFHSSLNLLMDRELPDADRTRIKALALAHPQVRSLHDLRTRSSGTRSFIQLHLELDGSLSLADAHAISDQVMGAIEQAFPNAEVLIHEDPHGLPERREYFDEGSASPV
jgi:ferrous-iron efflux pump FieF